VHWRFVINRDNRPVTSESPTNREQRSSVCFIKQPPWTSKKLDHFLLRGINCRYSSRNARQFSSRKEPEMEIPRQHYCFPVGFAFEDQSQKRLKLIGVPTVLRLG
jgi:hypothetical protein